MYSWIISGSIRNIYNFFLRIELRFRPDDPFCKPTHGEQVQTSNLLFKIIKTTKKNRITKKEEVTYQTKLEGVIRKTYRFLGRDLFG